MQAIGEGKVEKDFMITRPKLSVFIRIIAVIAFVLTVLTQFNSCSPDLSDDQIPHVPFDDISINLNLPAYKDLATVGGFMYIHSGGVKGLIVYRSGPSTYVVFERNCSYSPNDACATVEVHSSTLFMLDPCCGSNFRFPDGEPSGGIAWRPMRQYVSYYDGQTLVITDDIANP
jgi:hypothetical protein